MKKIFPFPPYIETEVRRIFSEKNWAWQSKSLAEDVLQLSDFYIHNPTATTPWEKEWAQRANLVYFWPLNTLRILKIKDELEQLHFYQGLDHLVDYGAGAGTASWILQNHFSKTQLQEKSSIPQKWFPQFQWVDRVHVGSQSLVTFSYSLTELEDLPQWSLGAEALLLIEPSTQQDGRKLLALRQKLIEKNYSLWAPCPHQTSCPLLIESKTDWCHDRVHIERPQWFLDIEKYLPMKNNTLTYSYLAARRSAPPTRSWARVTGDQLIEKGKTRQLICRGPKREFLSWMHRNGEAPQLHRGDRVILQNFEEKSNELRSPQLKYVE